MPPGAAPGLPAYYGRIWRFPGPARLCKGAIYYITGSIHSYCKRAWVELPFVIHYSYIISWGRHAFQRLQAEVARQNMDATLFAWDDCPRSRDDEEEPGDLSDNYDNHPDHPYIFLFAPSPSEFFGWWNAHSSPWIPPESLPTSPNSTPDDEVCVICSIHNQSYLVSE